MYSGPSFARLHVYMVQCFGWPLFVIIYCEHSTLTIGELSWPLGAQELPYPETLDKYRLFAQFLLQGKVWSGYNDELLMYNNMHGCR